MARAGAPPPHRRMRGRGQSQCLRPRPRAGDHEARRRRLQDILRRQYCRGAARAQLHARGGDLRPQWIFARGSDRVSGARRAAGHQQHDRACRMGRLRRRQELARRRRAPRRHRHEPARHFRRGSRGARCARANRKSRHRAVDESSGLRRDCRPRAQCRPDQAVSRCPFAVSRRSRLARQFLRHLPRRCGAFRHGEARRGALRHQSHSRSPQSDARRRGTDRPYPASAQRRARRGGRLRRHLDGEARFTARRRGAGLCRRAYPGRERQRWRRAAARR